jgi:hypothetical protein
MAKVDSSAECTEFGALRGAFQRAPLVADSTPWLTREVRDARLRLRRLALLIFSHLAKEDPPAGLDFTGLIILDHFSLRH